MENQNPDNNNTPLPASGLAIASLVLGICSIPTCLCYGVPSLICGIIGLILAHSASQQVAAGTAGGQGLIKAGRICSIIGLVLSVLYWIFLAVMIAVVAPKMKDQLKHDFDKQAQHDAQQNPPPAPAPSQP